MAKQGSTADVSDANDQPPPADDPVAAGDLWGFLKSELSDEAHQVAQDLHGDMPQLLQKLATAAESEAPAILKAVLAHPFMQHLEAQLPTAALGIAHGLLGLVL
jgi:hypothetical protein